MTLTAIKMKKLIIYKYFFLKKLSILLIAKKMLKATK
jgi:hypothetical protein